MELHARKAVTALKPEPAALWAEYGLQEAEKAEYAGAKGKFTVSAWRLNDATSAQAAWQFLRPANAKPSTYAKRAAVSGSELLITLGNYVLLFDGFQPEAETLNQLILAMPRFDNSSLPALTGFLPPESRHGNSERYILGPAGLAAFVPGLAPSVVAFHFGTEGQFARYKDKDGDLSLVLFNYPNQQIARERLTAFQELKEFTAKRSGPIVAVVTKAPNPDAAERLLSLVRWEANVTLNQQLPDPKGDNIGVLILNIAKFSGFMVFFALLVGLFFGGVRVLRRKLSGNQGRQQEAVIGLHIDESPSK